MTVDTRPSRESINVGPDDRVAPEVRSLACSYAEHTGLYGQRLLEDQLIEPMLGAASDDQIDLDQGSLWATHDA